MGDVPPCDDHAGDAKAPAGEVEHQHDQGEVLKVSPPAEDGLAANSRRSAGLVSTARHAASGGEEASTQSGGVEPARDGEQALTDAACASASCQRQATVRVGG